MSGILDTAYPYTPSDSTLEARCPAFPPPARAHGPALFQEIQSLLTNWKGPDLTSYGELVLEGTFRLQRAKNERTLFLFDKLLLITKKRDDTFTYKAHILVGLRVGRGRGLPVRVPVCSKGVSLPPPPALPLSVGTSCSWK